MNTNILKATLILFLSISLVSCAQNKKQNNESQSVETAKKEIVSLISPEDLNKANKEIQLIDVRTPEEYTEGHVNNAVNINFYDDNFLSEMNKLDKSKEIYIYCRSGGRSGKAAKKLKSQGFTKIYDLQGGFLNWKKKNLEIVK